MAFDQNTHAKVSSLLQLMNEIKILNARQKQMLLSQILVRSPPTPLTQT